MSEANGVSDVVREPEHAAAAVACHPELLDYDRIRCVAFGGWVRYDEEHSLSRLTIF